MGNVAKGRQGGHRESETADLIPGEVPPDGIFIIGAGHFGGRAARLLSADRRPPLFVVDVDRDRLSRLEDLPVTVIPSEGIRFLVRHSERLNPENFIVPAIPIHLAFEWLREAAGPGRRIRQIPVPEEVKEGLPFTWPGQEGSLLVSYADFQCPDDCPEPEYCTVTGERRDEPLYGVLGKVEVHGFRVHVVRSHQLAPGLGGYRVADLTGTAERVGGGQAGRWLLGTACKCHGVLTALSVEARQE
jgi:hypothetical protein